MTANVDTKNSPAAATESLGAPSRNVAGDPIWDAVVTILTTDCACDESEIAPSANFFHDLGLESIDLLDFSFRAERMLSVRSHINRLTKSDRWRSDDQGNITPDTAVWLAEELTSIGIEPPDFSKIETYRDIVTVEFLACGLRRAVAERGGGGGSEGTAESDAAEAAS